MPLALPLLMVVALSQPAAPPPSSSAHPPPERPPVGSATYMYFWPYECWDHESAKILCDIN
jgi:hypothetical protein